MSIQQNKIHIIGPCELQNILLSQYIVNRTGLKCACHQELVIPVTVNCNCNCNCNCNQPFLILKDCLYCDFIKSYDKSITSIKSKYDNARFALFNVSAGDVIMEDVINNGLQGIFYRNDSPSVIAKGSEAILNGELWFSRFVLSSALTIQRKTVSIKKEMDAYLTFREKEILTKLSAGVTNCEIADDLCISIHTVKTHLYNIYKKINVSTRLQASLWAARQLY